MYFLKLSAVALSVDDYDYGNNNSDMVTWIDLVKH